MKRRAAVAAAGIAAVIAGGAAAEDLRVFPVSGLYGLERSRCASGAAGSEAAAAKIDPAFCAAVDPRLIGRRFADLVRSAFPHAVTDLASQSAAGETAEARLSKTVIASLHIARAELWPVQKPDVTDVYVPITLTLELTNALTGEVMFVQNSTTIPQGTFAKTTYRQEAQQQFPAQFDAALEALVQAAAGRFKPYAIIGHVRAKVGDRFVVDVGRKQGIREGDTLGADAKVVFSDASYSVVAPLLGSLTVGQTLTHQALQPVEVLAKPSAMVDVAQAPPDVSRAYLSAVFSDALAQTASLAITPVDPDFSNLRRLAIGEAQLSSDYDSLRTLPDYFVRLSVVTLDPVDLETNQTHVRRGTYEAHAFVEIIDHSGRVVFATQGVNRITDEVLFGVGFSPDQRLDVVTKNAVVAAAAAVAKGFRPAAMRMDASPAGDDVEISDGGALGQGAHAKLLRRAGPFSGITGDVWVPVGDLEVTAVSPQGALARFADPTPLKARKGDKAAFDSGGSQVSSRRQFTPCMTADGMVDVSRRGAVDDPLFEPIAINSFASAFQAPVRLPQFAVELRPLLGDFPASKSLAALQPPAADVCFQPVYQIDQTGEKAAGAYVSGVYNVAMGYILRRDGAKVASLALQQTLTASGVPATTPPPMKLTALQYDLAAEAQQLTARALQGAKSPE
jgi:hypothetical protein